MSDPTNTQISKLPLRPPMTGAEKLSFIKKNKRALVEAAASLMAETGLRVRHMRLEAISAIGPVRLNNGGITVAYRHTLGNSYVELATSVCSVGDQYDRRVGTILAVSSFIDNGYIRVPLLGRPAEIVIDLMFGQVVTYTNDLSAEPELPEDCDLMIVGGEFMGPHDEARRPCLLRQGQRSQQRFKFGAGFGLNSLQ